MAEAIESHKHISAKNPANKVVFIRSVLLKHHLIEIGRFTTSFPYSRKLKLVAIFCLYLLLYLVFRAAELLSQMSDSFTSFSLNTVTFLCLR